MEAANWVIVPAVSAAIGWATNWVAVKMLFHPRRPMWGLHGLLPRRQQELAASVGQVVGGELVPVDDLLKGLDGVDLTPHLGEMLDKAINTKLDDVRRIPLIGGLVTPERVAGIRDGVLAQLKEAQPVLLARFKQLVKERIDVGALAREKLGAFDLDRLEGIVNHIAHREFRAIEWWGAILGGIIGVAQVGVMLLVERLSAGG
jgi:uncharacterized membrane protein YheB (UPF0754 family)